MKLRRKKRKREKQVTDLCECHISLSHNFSLGLLSICLPFLVNALLRRKGDEETQTEVEITLLNNVEYMTERKRSLKELMEIMDYHPERNNLAGLVITANEPDFWKDAAKELEMREKEREKKKKKKKKEDEKKRFYRRDGCKHWSLFCAHAHCGAKNIQGLSSGLRGQLDQRRITKEEWGRNGFVLFYGATDGRLIEIEVLMKDRSIDSSLEGIVRSEVGRTQIEICLSVFDSLRDEAGYEKE